MNDWQFESFRDIQVGKTSVWAFLAVSGEDVGNIQERNNCVSLTTSHETREGEQSLMAHYFATLYS